VLLKEPAEIALYAAMQDVAPRAFKTQFEAGDHKSAVAKPRSLALRMPDGAMQECRGNGLAPEPPGPALTLHEAMNRVADLSPGGVIRPHTDIPHSGHTA
jgi:glycyl-tRNA synthetase beta chain